MGRADARPLRTVALLLLLFVTLFTGLGLPSLGAPAAHADEISDAIAAARKRHRQAEQQIQGGQRRVRELAAAEKQLQQLLDSTGVALDTINTDEAAVRRDLARATTAFSLLTERHALLESELHRLELVVSGVDEEIDQSEEDLAERRARWPTASPPRTSGVAPGSSSAS